MSTPSDKAKSLDEILAEMQAVADKATSGPWSIGCGVSTRSAWSIETSDSFSRTVIYLDSTKNINLDEAQNSVEEDLEFIAMSREAMPRLIEALRVAIKQRQAYAKCYSETDEYEDGDYKQDMLADDAELASILQGRS